MYVTALTILFNTVECNSVSSSEKYRKALRALGKLNKDHLWSSRIGLTTFSLIPFENLIVSSLSFVFPPSLFASPQVIFSQSSDLLERQSSMASSTEEVSAPDLSAESRRNENDHFGVFKDFDFLEYESESVEVGKGRRKAG